ncbi:MAG: hypothetical protein CVV02_06310 [Firmicutes bacterium HGW-Firmicutes-7]|nr:MAG: hypothetical protein CVV02_06310 [Firmicutes bacterium HGW-Firmicutes-7]
MNENVQDFIYSTTALFLFVLALALFFFMNDISISMNEALNNANRTDRTVYETSKEAKAFTISGCEIIVKAHNGLECDIEVEGIEISKNIDACNFDLTIIQPFRQYEITNRINASGEIVKVIFK